MLCFILLIISEAYCTHFNGTFTFGFYAFPWALEGQTLPMAAPSVVAKHPYEVFYKFKFPWGFYAFLCHFVVLKVF